MSSSDDENVDCVETEEEDEERNEIRSELSHLSYEELQKLKEKLGAKIYKEALFGKNEKAEQGNKPKTFKRENKNRPRELSSKKPVPLLGGPAKTKTTRDIRDPRFDPLCGEFDKKEFAENYNFLSDFLVNDIKATKAELKTTTDPEKVQQLSRLLQRLKDKQRANSLKKKERERINQQQIQIKNDLAKGKVPQFKRKSEQRIENLVKQFEELKEKGSARVQRHIKRRQQKIRKRLYKAPTILS